MSEAESEWIDEDPLKPEEIERLLLPLFSRRERRQFLYVLRHAKLVVFRDDLC